jgi:hypothetical protein
MSYNPFEKPIGEKLDEANLKGLVRQQVTEGFFVEFKRELPSDRIKIARSIASFANTYGGWYIVGVTTDNHNVASDVLGFEPTEKQHDPTSVITEVLKVSVDPIPVFFTQVITLVSGRLAVVVYVPGDQACPFITKDGRIYRRTHDSSEPIAENSRYSLDELVQRGQKISEAFKRFAVDQRHEGNVVDRDSRICVFISPSPLGVVQKYNLSTQESVAAMVVESTRPRPLGDPFPETLTGNIPLDTALVRLRSIVLRQVMKGYEHEPGFSLELDTFGRCKICVPVNSKTVTELQTLQSQAASDVLAQLAHDHVNENMPIDRLRFFNIGDTWLPVFLLVSYYLNWLQPPPYIAGYDIAVEAVGVVHHVPFYDSDRWAEHVRTFGLPVTLRNRSRVPEFPEGGAWEVDAESLGIKICALVGAAVGLPANLLASITMSAILDAANRKKDM